MEEIYLAQINDNPLLTLQEMKTKQQFYKINNDNILQEGNLLIIEKCYKGKICGKDEIFQKIKNHILDLAKNKIGNYILKFMLEQDDINENVKKENKNEKDEDSNKKIPKTKRDTIFNTLENNIYDLSMHQYACYIISLFIDLKDNNYITKINEKIEKGINNNNLSLKKVEIFKNENSSHIIEKLIDYMDVKNISYIYKIIHENFLDLYDDLYAQHIISKILMNILEKNKENKNNEIVNQIISEESSNNYDSETKKIMEEILEDFKNNIVNLLLSKNGRYIINDILEAHKESSELIYEKIKGKIYEYSLHEFSYLVIQKLLKEGEDNIKKKIINEIIDERCSIDKISTLGNDKYGNYVVQEIIDIVWDTDPKIKEKIIKVFENESDKEYNIYVKKYIKNKKKEFK